MGKPLQAVDYSRFTAFPDLHLSPVALHLGPFDLRWYSLAYLAGIIIGYWYLLKLIEKPGSPMARRDADDLAFYAALGIFLGGRIGYVLFYNLGEYLRHPIEILKLWDGGMSFHGGVVGTSLGILYFARKEKLSWLRVHDYVACCVPFGLFFGRLANFINQELWGAPTTVPWAVRFVEVTPFGPMLGPPRHPSQIYEAVLEGIVLFAILAFMFWRTKAEGPITVEAFMEACNAYYYATRDPLGAKGDFTTAPEISQMFGELVGASLADCWKRAGSPEDAIYVELGPGRGTLSADALR